MRFSIPCNRYSALEDDISNLVVERFVTMDGRIGKQGEGGTDRLIIHGQVNHSMSITSYRRIRMGT
jgi:hypothetical protein